uniref:Rab-GAP TBC domain-containing protein n=1 Tax=Chromera velia CCMP2878 TaxID=1169474 RepID=A0A0G4G3X1_9ALVE|eukprot:Cvel_20169.t1-p1 / transcript=Cvel_20169.t1 / gene=Cvel_20169 / organism=Chromera_velia_CCMP2878 / gene_product=TBC1 domain family member 12, putative / transcript_product=TBC1 domain family member 12, putative / location=Cvel_scaffold1792:7439-18381(-) / protein_length=1832 / sequence_SO=supercontig / SO=protein_coding / is_pseudo=false
MDASEKERIEGLEKLLVNMKIQVADFQLAEMELQRSKKVLMSDLSRVAREKAELSNQLEEERQRSKDSRSAIDQLSAEVQALRDDCRYHEEVLSKTVKHYEEQMQGMQRKIAAQRSGSRIDESEGSTAEAGGGIQPRSGSQDQSEGKNRSTSPGCPPANPPPQQQAAPQSQSQHAYPTQPSSHQSVGGGFRPLQSIGSFFGLSPASSPQDIGMRLAAGSNAQLPQAAPMTSEAIANRLAAASASAAIATASGEWPSAVHHEGFEEGGGMMMPSESGRRTGGTAAGGGGGRQMKTFSLNPFRKTPQTSPTPPQAQEGMFQPMQPEGRMKPPVGPSGAPTTQTHAHPHAPLQRTASAGSHSAMGNATSGGLSRAHTHTQAGGASAVQSETDQRERERGTPGEGRLRPRSRGGLTTDDAGSLSYQTATDPSDASGGRLARREGLEGDGEGEGEDADPFRAERGEKESQSPSLPTDAAASFLSPGEDRALPLPNSAVPAFTSDGFPAFFGYGGGWRGGPGEKERKDKGAPTQSQPHSFLPFPGPPYTRAPLIDIPSEHEDWFLPKELSGPSVPPPASATLSSGLPSGNSIAAAAAAAAAAAGVGAGGVASASGVGNSAPLSATAGGAPGGRPPSAPPPAASKEREKEKEKGQKPGGWAKFTGIFASNTPSRTSEALNPLDVWLETLLPDWDNQRGGRLFKQMIHKGVPPEIRGEVWKRAIGDRLHLTPSLYRILLRRVASYREFLLAHSSRYRDKIRETLGSAVVKEGLRGATQPQPGNGPVHVTAGGGSKKKSAGGERERERSNGVEGGKKKEGDAAAGEKESERSEIGKKESQRVGGKIRDDDAPSAASAATAESSATAEDKKRENGERGSSSKDEGARGENVDPPSSSSFSSGREGETPMKDVSGESIEEKGDRGGGWRGEREANGDAKAEDRRPCEGREKEDGKESSPPPPLAVSSSSLDPLVLPKRGSDHSSSSSSSMAPGTGGGGGAGVDNKGGGASPKSPLSPKVQPPALPPYLDPEVVESFEMVGMDLHRTLPRLGVFRRRDPSEPSHSPPSTSIGNAGGAGGTQGQGVQGDQAPPHFPSGIAAAAAQGLSQSLATSHLSQSQSQSQGLQGGKTSSESAKGGRKEDVGAPPEQQQNSAPEIPVTQAQGATGNSDREREKENDTDPAQFVKSRNVGVVPSNPPTAASQGNETAGHTTIQGPQGHRGSTPGGVLGFGIFGLDMGGGGPFHAPRGEGVEFVPPDEVLLHRASVVGGNLKEEGRRGSGEGPRFSQDPGHPGVRELDFGIPEVTVLHEHLRTVLEVWAVFRPDIGYVQGMAYIAAMLLLHMDEFSSFVCFANLMMRRSLLSFYTFTMDSVGRYFGAFERLMDKSLPQVGQKLRECGLTSDMYLVEWMYTLFTRSLPFDLVTRVWDLFVVEGDPVLFQVSLGILAYFESDIVKGNLDTVMHLLSSSATLQLQSIKCERFLEGMYRLGISKTKVEHAMKHLEKEREREREKERERERARQAYAAPTATDPMAHPFPAATGSIPFAPSSAASRPLSPPVPHSSSGAPTTAASEGGGTTGPRTGAPLRTAAVGAAGGMPGSSEVPSALDGYAHGPLGLSAPTPAVVAPPSTHSPVPPSAKSASVSVSNLKQQSAEKEKDSQQQRQRPASAGTGSRPTSSSRSAAGGRRRGHREGILQKILGGGSSDEDDCEGSGHTFIFCGPDADDEEEDEQEQQGENGNGSAVGAERGGRSGETETEDGRPDNSRAPSTARRRDKEQRVSPQRQPDAKGSGKGTASGWSKGQQQQQEEEEEDDREPRVVDISPFTAGSGSGSGSPDAKTGFLSGGR